MDKELDLLRGLSDFKSVSKSYDNSLLTFEESVINNNEIFIAKCGIGKVNSAINTYRLFKAIKPDLVINSGVAGGVNLKIGTLLLADKVCYHDVWCGPGTPEGQADGMPLYFIPDNTLSDKIKDIFNNEITTGLICSGDRFISKKEEISKIRELFPDALAVDMESAAIAHVCALTHTPFIILRVVSDTPGEGENISQYKNFWKEAPEKNFSIIKEILNLI